MSNIQLKCPKCGSSAVVIPRPNPRDTDIFTCPKCRGSYTYAALAKPIADKMGKDAVDAITKAFKGLQ